MKRRTEHTGRFRCPPGVRFIARWLMFVLPVAMAILYVGLLFGGRGEPSATSGAVDDRNVMTVEASTHHRPAIEPPNDFDAPEVRRVTVLAVGDVLLHLPVTQAAWDPKESRYRFEPFFEPVRPILKDGDIVMANMETPVAGASYGYHGYPRFNGPEAIIDALKWAGFNVLTTANNHALDQGPDGASNTRTHIEARGLWTTGIARSAEEAEDVLMIEKNGLKTAILAYTYGTNGIPLPKDRPFLVKQIDPEAMRRDITLARARGADAVVVSLHFGTEYVDEPSADQRNLVYGLIADGADLVIGSHPHVLQPIEHVALDTPGGRREGWVIYSLGNFISDQRGTKRQTGGIFKAVLEKSGMNSVRVASIDFIPTWAELVTSAGRRTYRVIPLEEKDGAADEVERVLEHVFRYVENAGAVMPALRAIGRPCGVAEWSRLCRGGP
ncbi:MAG: CapA family protein [Hydrogenibacillus sp.]|nr:CapA family protein [Hydrogenibacillus sp.]